MAAKKELLLIEIREDGARVVKRNIEGVGKAGDKTSGQMDKLKSVLAGLVSAKVLRDTILLADAYANMLNRLRVVTESTWELHASMEGVYKMSRQTRTSLEANVDMYNRIAINTRQMGLEMEDVIRFSKQLNHAIILSGVTAREAQWGMVQFSQGLAAGALRGDELRAVMEQLPIVTQTLTRYLGIGRGELRKWAFEGRVTTRVIIDAFEQAEESLAERFGRRIPTVDQALTVLNNSILKFVGGMDQAIQGTQTLAQGIMWVADNMNMLGRFVMVVGTVLGTIFLKNLIMIVAQMRLFSLEMLKVSPLATGLMLAGAAMVVFSDKIKIANDSTATLADFMKELGKNALTAYKVLREGVAGLFSGDDIHMEYVVTFESILVDAAKFTDKFLGLFVGAGEVIKKVFGDVPNYAKRAWNGILNGIETVADTIIAVFKSIGDMLQIFALNVQSGMSLLSGAAEQLLAGNAAKAKEYADQAALSFKNAAKDGFRGFSDILDKNLREAASEDRLAGAKLVVEQAGETIGDAFGRGFAMSDILTAGVDQLLKRTKAMSADGDPREAGVPIFSPTPAQSELLKSMLGDIGKVNNQMLQLQELWAAINTKQPGTEGMDVTLEQVNRKMTELKLKSMEVNTDVISGFQRGFMKLGLGISDFANTAEKAVVSAFKGMENALVEFVKTGKVSFTSLVDGILADLTRLLARQALMGLLQGMAGTTPGGLLSNVAGAFGAAPTQAALDASFVGPRRALGGSVSPGMQYMVGERRPELFQPAQPGHITPTTNIQPPAQEGAVTIINVATEEAAISAMQTAEGKRVIRNEIRTYKSGGGI